MEEGDGLEERAALEEAHAEARVHAAQKLSRALAEGARYASQRLPRASKVKPHKLEAQHAEALAAANIKALAAMKSAPKHKPRVIKFTGAVTVPTEAVRVEAPPDAPRLPFGWTRVYYQEGPHPVGSTMAQLKTYRKQSRRQGLAGGLGSAYKRGVQLELVPGPAELEAEEAVSEEDTRKLEAWQAQARQRLEEQQQQQQLEQRADIGAGPAPKPTPSSTSQPSLALPSCTVDERLAARARAIAAVPAPVPNATLRFQGGLHAPTALQPGATQSSSCGSWQQLPAPSAAAPGPKLGDLASLPPTALKRGVPRSHLAAVYQGRPGAGAVAFHEEGSQGDDVEMDG